jgi:hypothetical protein
VKAVHSAASMKIALLPESSAESAKARSFPSVEISAAGPLCRTCAMHKVVGYLEVLQTRQSNGRHGRC